jgi:hypothetical protein
MLPRTQYTMANLEPINNVTQECDVVMLARWFWRWVCIPALVLLGLTLLGNIFVAGRHFPIAPPTVTTTTATQPTATAPAVTTPVVTVPPPTVVVIPTMTATPSPPVVTTPAIPAVAVDPTAGMTPAQKREYDIWVLRK